MKRLIHILAYIAAFAIGIILLINNHQPKESDSSILNGVIVAIGITFALPGLVLLLLSMKPKKEPDGSRIMRPWYTYLVSSVALIWGIYMICLPEGIRGNLSITFGITLIIAGIAEFVWLIGMMGKIVKYITPLLIVGVGVVVLLLPSYYKVMDSASVAACITSGISLIVWSLNGLAFSKPRISGEKR